MLSNAKKNVIFYVMLCMLGLSFPALAQETEGGAAATVVTAILVLIRWMHILPVIIMLGGSYFFRFVLLPTGNSALDPGLFKSFKVQVIRKWRMMIMLCMALILISGFLYYFMVGRAEHDGEALYHALFGIKFILAMVVFTLISMVYGSKQRLGAKGPMVGAITIALGIVVVLIAGYMRMM